MPCVCPVIDHEFRHNCVKVAVEPGGDNVMTKFVVDKTDALKTAIKLFFTITICPLSVVDASRNL